MDQQLRIIYQKHSTHHDTLGILHVQRKDAISPVTDGFDAILLVITNNTNESWYMHHYVYIDYKIQLIVVNKDELNDWLAAGSNRRAVEWVIFGRILFDRDDFLSSLRERIVAFPFSLRRKKMCIEFGRLIRRYQEGKELLQTGDLLDAFNQMLHALHHWARMVVIEYGFHPEVTLWRQVKNIEPEIYKLYDELVKGTEPLEKRIELLLIASELSFGSKTNLATSHLKEIMKSKSEPWLLEELISHPDIREYSLDLSILLEHMVRRNLVEEIRLKDSFGQLQVRAYRLRSG